MRSPKDCRNSPEAKVPLSFAELRLTFPSHPSEYKRNPSQYRDLVRMILHKGDQETIGSFALCIPHDCQIQAHYLKKHGNIKRNYRNR